jgi:hypothetical protein
MPDKLSDKQGQIVRNKYFAGGEPLAAGLLVYDA